MKLDQKFLANHHQSKMNLVPNERSRMKRRYRDRERENETERDRERERESARHRRREIRKRRAREIEREEERERRVRERGREREEREDTVWRSHEFRHRSAPTDPKACLEFFDSVFPGSLNIESTNTDCQTQIGFLGWKTKTDVRKSKTKTEASISERVNCVPPFCLAKRDCGWSRALAVARGYRVSLAVQGAAESHSASRSFAFPPPSPCVVSLLLPLLPSFPFYFAPST